MYKCTQQAWIYPSKQRCWHVGLPSCKLTWPWNIGLFEDACPIEHGDLPSLVFVYQSVCSDHLESIWIYLFFSPKSPHSYNALPETSHACRSWNGRFFSWEKERLTYSMSEKERKPWRWRPSRRQMYTSIHKAIDYWQLPWWNGNHLMNIHANLHTTWHIIPQPSRNDFRQTKRNGAPSLDNSCAADIPAWPEWKTTLQVDNLHLKGCMEYMIAKATQVAAKQKM